MRKLIAWFKERKAEWRARNNIYDCVECDSAYIGVTYCPYCTGKKTKK